ncbi:developmentally-regulated GTP-binding protein [Pseudoscourfieldia marina]
MGILERIKDIELEMARTQKNKATEGHLGKLKAQIAKLRSQLLEAGTSGSGGKGEGFEVSRFGHARVALIGFPSVGKSTLLTQLTGTDSESAAYEFTTLTCIPGVIHYNDAKIQLLDLPGIIEGASQGKGRGRQVIAVAKSSDLVLMVLDATKPHSHREILTRELETVGLRLNQHPPDISLIKKKTGGITFSATCELTHVDERVVYQILHEYKIHNADVLFRGDHTVDELIDVIEGNRKYVPCLYVFNKIDMLCIEEVDEIARRENTVPISCYMELNLDGLLARMWETMSLVRVYTKKRGGKPDFDEPVVLSADRGGTRVENFCNHLHRDLAKDLMYAWVWGGSVRYTPQRCGKDHDLHDEDVVQVVKKKKAAVGEAIGRFRQGPKDEPARIADRVKKAPLKT